MAREMSLIVNPSLGMYQKSGFSQQQQQNCTEVIVRNQPADKINILECCSCSASLFSEKLVCLGNQDCGNIWVGTMGYYVLAHPQGRKHANESTSTSKEQKYSYWSNRAKSIMTNSPDIQLTFDGEHQVCLKFGFLWREMSTSWIKKFKSCNEAPVPKFQYCKNWYPTSFCHLCGSMTCKFDRLFTSLLV